MKTLILVLLLLSFFQTTIVPFDLVLIILILRSYIQDDRANLYLAFGFGLLISLLENYHLGFLSVVYIILIQLTHIFSKAPVAKNMLTIIPLIFILLLGNEEAIAFLTNQSAAIWPKVALEALIAFPMYIILILWEERFVVKKEIKLKV